MDSQLENAIQKRKHDEDISNEYKRKKLETPETPEEGDGVTKLTDVIDDCLERIFGYLKLQDLINIAETCKQFQSLVKLTLAAKFKGKLVKLCSTYDSYSYPFELIKLNGDTIEIWNLSNCLKVLRHFGSLITKLNVHYSDMTRNQSAALARYMNEYCADSLIDIKMTYAPEQMLASWTKPFSNAQSIEIFNTDLGDLNFWFPKMRRLVPSYDFKFIINTFPYLEELEIFAIKKKKVKEMLRLNPNLQKLCLPYGVEIKFIASVSKYMQSLRFLDIDCDHEFFNQEVPPIYLKNVEEFHVKILKDCYALDVPKIPFSFDRLEKLQLAVGTKMIRRIDNLMNFIRQNRSLVKLTIYVKYELNALKAEAEQIKMRISTEFEWLDVEMKQFTNGPAHSSIGF